MSFRVTHIPCDDTFSQSFSVSLLEESYPRTLVCELLSHLHGWEERERKLSQLVMVYLLLAWHLFGKQSLRSVFVHLSAGLRLLTSMPVSVVPSQAAFLHRRKQLGVRLVRRLLRRACKPLATPQTPGAFAWGYRLTAIAATLEEVAESPANARFFGRIASGKTASPSPQARCVYLVEVATHLLLEAIIAPCKASEQRLWWGVRRSISADMLVLLDRTFVWGAFLQALGLRGAQVLARLSAGLFLRQEQVLADGSSLTTLSARCCKGMHQPLQVRVSE